MRQRAAALLEQERLSRIGAKGHAKKYEPGKDPLEQEPDIPEIRSLAKQEQTQLKAMIEKMIRAERNKDRRKALRFHQAQINIQEAEGMVQHEFLRDFWAWILGRGKETDHKNTPWYRQALTDDPEVAAYVDSFMITFQQYRLKLEIMKLRRPRGIDQTFLYFKYLVRGKEPSTTNFLHDWEIFENQFDWGRAQGQDIWDHGPKHGHPHEVAPYGDEDRNEAGQQINDDGNERIIAMELDEDDEDDEDFDPNQSPDRQVQQTRRRMQDGGAGAGAPAAPPPPPPPRGGGDRGATPMDTSDGPENDASSAPVDISDASISALASAISEAMKRTPEENIAAAGEIDAEAKAQIESLQGEIAELKKQLDASKAAKLPSPELETRLGELEKGQGNISEIQRENLETMKRIEEGLKRSREERQQDLNELIKNMPKLEGSKEIVVNPEGIQQMNDNMAKFHGNFAAFMGNMDKRMQELERNRNVFPESTVVIEEIKEQSNQLKQLGDTLREQAKEHLNASEKIEGAIIRRDAKTIAAESKSAEELLKRLQESNRVSEEGMRQFSMAFASEMRKMMDAFANQNRQEREASKQQLEKLIGAVPVNNAQESRLMFEQVNTMMKKMQEAQDRLRITNGDEGETVKELKSQVEKSQSEAATWKMRAETERANLEKTKQAADTYLQERLQNVHKSYATRLQTLNKASEAEKSEILRQAKAQAAEEKEQLKAEARAHFAKMEQARLAEREQLRQAKERDLKERAALQEMMKQKEQQQAQMKEQAILILNEKQRQQEALRRDAERIAAEKEAVERAARETGERMRAAEEKAAAAARVAQEAVNQLPKAAKVEAKNQKEEERMERETREEVRRQVERANRKLAKGRMPLPAPQGGEKREREIPKEKGELSDEMEQEEPLTKEEEEAAANMAAKSPRLMKRKNVPLKPNVPDFEEEELEHVEFGLRKEYKAMRKVEMQIDKMHVEKDPELIHWLAQRSTKPKVIRTKITLYEQFLRRVGKKADL